jgi:prevent-host-death family protein
MGLRDMKTVSINEAKANLSRLIQKACRGEEIVIARGNAPVVRLVPIGAASGRRKLGTLKGKLVVGKKFFEALPRQELDPWEGCAFRSGTRLTCYGSDGLRVDANRKL